MSDQVTVKMEQHQKSFTPAPVGSQHAVCVDVIDMGQRVESFKDQPKRLSPKVVLVFQTADVNAETGARYEVSIEFTASFGAKAKLRKMLGGWRGKPYSDEEAMAGAPLHKLVGVNAVLNVLHKTSGQGRTYAAIDSIAPPMKGLPKIEPDEYVRGEYWAQRKAEYAAEVAEFKKAATVAGPGAWNAPPLDEMPPALQDVDDELPFRCER